MVRSSKWLTGTDPEQPLVEVARIALQGRLKTVRHYMPLAAKKSHVDIEFVHQLRVSTRRARAALQIFRDLLPRRQAKWMNRRLRKLRRAAGTARDLDVLGERLRMLANKQEVDIQDVVQRLAVRRRDAQKSLAASCKELKRKRFKQRSRELVKSVRWPEELGDPRFGVAARVRLRPLLEGFLASAANDLSDIKAMHQLRISGKQLRYAMELLGGAFDESFRGDLYAHIQELQERLGTINDHATAIATFTELLAHTGRRETCAELVELIGYEQDLLAAKRREFSAWWTPERLAELSQRFTAALASATKAAAATGETGKCSGDPTLKTA